jgi:trans-aconitate methyltransferase
VNESRFSDIGHTYDDQLAEGLRFTGEAAEFFAARRVARVRELVDTYGAPAKCVLDFGSGRGVAFAPLRAHFPDANIIAFEPEESLRDIALETARASNVEVLDFDVLPIRDEVDVVYCNGVFHHIARKDRLRVMKSLVTSMHDRALSFVWENSPYNPGTRFVMSRIAFDRDAELLTPEAMRDLQKDAGLDAIATEYHFVFPRALRLFRPVERLLRSVPVGGQYLVVSRGHRR